MLKGTITLNDQEREGTYDFTKAALYMTRGFKHKFGDEAEELILKSIETIMERYPDNADYFQTLQYTSDNITTKYWLIIDDYGNKTYILTALLPEEY